jgi:hypothetical protein
METPDLDRSLLSPLLVLWPQRYCTHLSRIIDAKESNVVYQPCLLGSEGLVATGNTYL